MDTKTYVEILKLVAKYVWEAIKKPRWTTQVKYMCGKHWVVNWISSGFGLYFGHNEQLRRLQMSLE